MGVFDKRRLVKAIGVVLGTLLVLPLTITAATSSDLSVEEGAKQISFK